MSPIDFQKEHLRITISLGLIAFFTALVFGIYQTNIGDNTWIVLIKTIVYGWFIVSSSVLFLFILLTAVRLKYKNPDILDGTIPIGEKSRKFFYDEGIESIYRGIIIGSVSYLSMRLVKVIDLSDTVINFVIFFVLFFILFMIFDFLIFNILKD